MNSYYFQTICAGSLVYAVRIFGFPSRPGIVYPLNAQSFSSLLLPPNHRISLALPIFSDMSGLEGVVDT